MGNGIVSSAIWKKHAEVSFSKTVKIADVFFYFIVILFFSVHCVLFFRSSDYEGIAAGTVLGRDICLLHCKVHKNNVEIWIKTSSKLLSEVTMKECISFLQNS